LEDIAIIQALPAQEKYVLSTDILIYYHLPNRYSWIDFLARCFPGKYKHDYRYTRRDIEGFASAVGFDLSHVRRYGFLQRNSLSALPPQFRRSILLAATWDALDAAFSFVLSPLCQNYAFVGRKT
jgi:hypothetical protein